MTHITPASVLEVSDTNLIPESASGRADQQDDPGDVDASRDLARTTGGSDMQNRSPHVSVRCVTRGDQGTPTIERIGSQIKPQANGCWLWRGRTDIYGLANVGGKYVTVHRYVWEILVGPIPEGHHLHHKCETPSCCNPAHLEPLTPKEHKAAHRELDRVR